MEDKNKGGRPLKFKSAKELQEKVDEYFDNVERITLSGLALYLGIDRKTLFNYKKNDKFFPIVKKARDRVEAHYEERAIYEEKPTGVIFALKNMEWSDKQEVKQENSGEMNINITRKTI